MLFLCLPTPKLANLVSMLIRLWNILDFRIKTALGGVLAMTVCLIFLTMPSATEKVGKQLAPMGFSLTGFEAIKSRPGKITVEKLALDADGFSMIGKIESEGNATYPLIGKPERITISDLQLTGEWNEETGLTFAGWSVPPQIMNNQQNVSRIILNNGIIDLDTPAGAIRLEVNGESAMHPDKQHLSLFNAHLSGKQLQLILDTNIKGNWQPNHGLSLEAEIREGRLNLEHLNATRISGWISMEPIEGTLIPEVSGQLQAGQFGNDGLILQNVSFTFDGPLNNPHTIINASLGGFPTATLLLETQTKPEGTEVLANIETQSMNDLVSILSNLRTSAETSPLLQQALMTLLITEGNLERIKKDLKKEKFDSYVMEIEGYSHDLKGKIIAKKIKDGIVQRQIFSLNPAVAAGERRK